MPATWREPATPARRKHPDARGRLQDSQAGLEGQELSFRMRVFLCVPGNGSCGTPEHHFIRRPFDHFMQSDLVFGHFEVFFGDSRSVYRGAVCL